MSSFVPLRLGISSVCFIFAVESLEGRQLLAATFTIDASQNVHAISKFIYGANSQPLDAQGSTYSNVTSIRAGGNRWTAYNWENNASNAGSDYIFQNDDYLGGGNTPGGATIPYINKAASQNAATILTVPMAGYVSADKNGGGDVHNSGADYLSTRFKQIVNVKGSPFSLTPNAADANVYTDEYINWLKTNYAYGQSDSNKPIMFDLDNEPDLWNSTHAEIHPAAPTYAEMVGKTIATSSAIKSVEPNAMVLGPVNYGWAGYVHLQDAPDANGRDFQSYYLQQMAAASATAGKRLIDALDVHWYPEAKGTNGVRITNTDGQAATVAARLQAPRSLWDPTYVENSWIAQDSLGNQPINLLPRLKAKIDANYPGTKLSMTEYNYGGGTDISGAIAEADVLGILGVQNVYNANVWQLQQNGEPFIASALNLYRNFDAAGGTFGDTSIGSTTNDVANTSIYGSYDSASRKTLTLVAINKTANSNVATINLSNLAPGATAQAYQVTAAAASPVSAGSIALNGAKSFNYTMPAYSVTLIKIPLTTAAPIAWTGAGGTVNLADATNWSTKTLPTATDDAVINLTASNPTITLMSGSISVNNLVSNENILLSGSSSLNVNGTATINATLSVGGNATFKLASGGTHTLRTNALNIDTSKGAAVDLNDNSMIVDYSSASPMTIITSAIRNSRADAAWNGAGITSSAARTNPLRNTTLGTMEASDFKNINGTSAAFAGQTIDTTGVLVKYTYNGDANFDGKVDANDYARIDAGFQNQMTPGFSIGWLSGDFNYDGKIDANDYALIDAAYQTQGSPFLPRGEAFALGSGILVGSGGKNARLDGRQ